MCKPLRLATALVVLTGCAALIPAAPPAIDFVACVTKDALDGLSIPQIASPTPPGCGGDVLTVIETLLASKDPNVQASAAFGEATRVKAGLALMTDGGAK